MNLYVNGCSFTYGHETKENRDTFKSRRPEWTWSDHLSKHFDGRFVNEAWAGGSNNRIFRRTLSFFNSVKENDWVVVIQLTNPFNRFEYFDESNNIFVGMINNEYLLDDQYYNNMDVPFDLLKEKSEKSAAYRNLLFSEKEIAIAYFQQIISLHSYLKKRNISCLFTLMSSYCSPSKIINRLVAGSINSLDAQLLELFDIIPHNDITIPVSYMIDSKTMFDDDGHPNKAGHQQVYSYILNELQQRNYL